MPGADMYGDRARSAQLPCEQEREAQGLGWRDGAKRLLRALQTQCLERYSRFFRLRRENPK